MPEEDEVVRRTPYEWGRLIIMNLVIVVIPTIIYYRLRVAGNGLLQLHLTIAAFYAITALVVMWEALATIRRRRANSSGEPSGLRARLARLLHISGGRLPETELPPPGSITFIVAAFLPNERLIILETIRHLLTSVERPTAGFEVILAYNTPCDLPVEKALAGLAATESAFTMLRVDGSESKAENVNAAIRRATGDVICILDADHQPCSDCVSRAWRWLQNGYDVVQGRSVIRNHPTNFLTRMIAVEFESIYAVSHTARSLVLDTAIFGGSNGYWRADVLKAILFDGTMMTEDIDASSRALLAGYRIAHDRSIISAELAPDTFHAFWCQRKRWAQGWLQVSLKYQRPFWTTKHLTLAQKIHWTYLLLYRELYPIITLQVFPVIFSLLLYQGDMPMRTHWFLLFSTVVTLASGPMATISSMRHAKGRYPAWYGIVYALCVVWFVMIKNAIALVAMYDQLFKNTDWVVTRRGISGRLQSELADDVA